MSQNFQNCCNIGISSSSIASSSGRDLQNLKNYEFSSVAEKILQSVNAAFERDDSIDEFDIIPQESQANRSPVIHISQKLALESWCIPFVYVHSLRHFISLTGKFGKHGRGKNSPPPASLITKETSPGDECVGGKIKINFSQLSEIEKTGRAMALSRVLVLLNPDLAMVWNFRKEAYTQGRTSLKNEIDLITLAASRKPKCPEGFSYRRWLMQNHMNSESFKPEQSFELFETEGSAVERAAIKYFSNYHAWNYRHFLLDVFLENKNVPKDQKNAILEYEKGVSDDWLKSHVSDNSGFHYRQKLLDRIVSANGISSKEGTKVYSNELQENVKMILYYPGHESLWYHRRAVLKRLTETIRISSSGDSLDSIYEDFLTIKEDEIRWIQLTKSDNVNQNVSEIEERLKIKNQLAFVSQEYLSLNKLYSERHIKWLTYSINLL